MSGINFFSIIVLVFQITLNGFSQIVNSCTYNKCTGEFELQTEGVAYTYRYVGSNDYYNLQYARFYYQNKSGAWIQFYSIWNEGESQYAISPDANDNTGRIANVGTTAKYNSYSFVIHNNNETVYSYNFETTGNGDLNYTVPNSYHTKVAHTGINQNGDGDFRTYFKYKFHGVAADILATGTVKIKMVQKYWNDGSSVDQENIHTITIPTIEKPIDLTATTDLCGKVDLKWTNNTQTWESLAGCTTSDLKYANILYRDNVRIAQLAGDVVTYTDNSATVNNLYTYKVQRILWSKTNLTNVPSIFSTSVEGRTKKSPEQPTNFTATKSKCDRTINLNWEWNSDNPKDFIVRRGTTLNGSFAQIKVVSINDRQFIDSNLTRGARYFYRLCARNTCDNESGQSMADGISPIDPAIPSNTTLTALSDTSVRINWQDNANNETKYVIDRRDDEGNLNSFNANINSTSYIDNKMASCRRYTYQLRVVGECVPEGLVSTGTVTGMLPPPNLNSTFSGNKKLTCSKGYFNNRIELNWSNNNNAIINNIKIFRKVSGASTDSVQIAAVNAGNGLYIDNTADAGEFYQYSIVGEVTCNGAFLYSNVSTDIGYRSPTATITGNVQYAGGVAVDSVQILLEKTSGNSGYAASFNGADSLTIPHSSTVSPMSALSVEAWIKFEALSGNPILFEKANSYKLIYNSATSNFSFTVNGLTTTSITASNSAVLTNTYHHIAAVYNGSTLRLFIDGAQIGSAPSSGNISQNSNSLIIGKKLKGKMDEIRVWNSARSVSDVSLNYNRILNGDEAGLSLLFHADENSGKYLYDQSKSGTTFNQNHGKFVANGFWSSEIPSPDQLGYVGITNSKGNYTISGIRYSGTGENFTITPAYLTHEFTPGVTAVFIGDNSIIQNGINFIDKSSFTVTGYVTYSNSTCTAKGIYLKIDNKVVVGSDNNVITTDSKGFYTIEVPIGKHFISVEAPNHVFSKGRWPDSLTHDFQKPLTRIDFVDNTFLTVVGRVVGGDAQAQKKPGLGRSKNNIGQANLVFVNTGGCHTVTETTNSVTGEYTASLHPLIYNPTVGVIKNTAIDFGTLSQINMEGNFPLISVKDSVTITGSNALLRIDSANYHRIQNYIHYSKPIMSVFDNVTNKPFIGDTVFEYKNPTTDAITPIILNNGNLLGQKGVMTKKKNYALKIMVYESYINYDLPIKRDSIPVTNGSLVIINNLADTVNRTLDLTKISKTPNFNPEVVNAIVYRFNGGNPNFNRNGSAPQKNYRQDLTIALNTSWPTSNTYNFEAFLLGERSLGNEYFTKGPEVVDFILRDPPGNASFATREVGTTQEYTASYEWDAGTTLKTQKVIAAGAKFSTGLGVSVATEIEANVSLGMESSISGGKGGEVSYSTTNTKAWSTNSSPTKPGAQSDLFIGESKNINFSVSEFLDIMPDSTIARLGYIKLPGQDHITGTGFGLVTKVGLGATTGDYRTSFMYTTDYIESIEIPKLVNLRNIFLSGNFEEYKSFIPDSLVKIYGLNNDDPIFGVNATPEPNRYTLVDHNGPSYRFTPSSKYTSDTVRYFNQQIRLWKEALALNEYEKVIVDYQAKRDSAKNASLSALEKEYLDVRIGYALLSGLSAGSFVSSAAAGLIPGAGFVSYGVGLGVVIGASELENEFNEYLNKRKNINDRFADTKTNKSISGGVEYSDSQTFETLLSTSSHIEYAMAPDLKNKIKANVNGTGVEAENSITMKLTKNHSSSKTNTESKTISYVIKDEDLKDNFSVDIYPSILGFGPIFKLKAGGATKCPHEDTVKTKYYRPGTVVSEATRQREDPGIKVTNATVKGIPDDEAASFNLTVTNNSLDPFQQEYLVFVDPQTNPNGAQVSFSGIGPPSAFLYLDKGMSSDLTLSIKAGSSGILKYENIQVYAVSKCQYNTLDGEKIIAKSVNVNAEFLSRCTKLSSINLANNWVSNTSNKDTISLAIGNYNINKYGLEHLDFEYKPSSDAKYTAVQAWYDSVKNSPSPNPLLIPTDKQYIDYKWATSLLPDGKYDIRLTSHCSVYGDKKNKVITESEVYSGLIDRINPHPFGTPSPGDGILDPGEDISIQFNEPIDLGSLTKNFNFDIRGVLNNSAIRHSTSLLFDGVKDNVEVTAGANLQKRSFTFEFWAKMNGANTTEQAFISQGSEPTQSLFIGYDANGKFVIRFGTTEVASNNSVSDRTDWKHYAISCNYNPSTSFTTVTLLVDGVVVNSNSTLLSLPYLGSGKLFFGKEGYTNSKFFKGNMHEMRLWNNARTRSSVVSTMSSNLGTNTTGLLYNWKMDEAVGLFSKDVIRSRNAVINGAVWQLDPLGYSASFDGLNDYVSAKIPRSSITKEMDFTLEFWFNSSNKSTNATLFSNGKGDGLGSDSLYSWNIQNDNNGLLHVFHKGIDFVATNKDYFDGQWHHFALIMKRSNTLSAYIDGNLENSIFAKKFAELSCDSLYFGARKYYTGTIQSSDHYFNGKLDEVRFWNTARNQEQINRDKQFSLLGDEAGLKLYLPFETYSVANRRLESSIANSTKDTSVKANNFGGIVYTQATPSIKLPREVEQIEFTFALNVDQIIITPTTLPSLIENVKLDITVKDARDLNKNIMSSPKTWIAYINKNQVKWQEQEFLVEKLVSEKRTFEATIVNTGGELKSYTIGNLPSWLTTSNSSGVVAPNSYVKVQFTIDESENIGYYEEDLTLTTNFGYAEKLTIKLKNSAKAPNWTINPGNFQYSQGVVSQIKIDDIISTNLEDKVAAFVGNECRGVTNLKYYPEYDKYFAVLDIYSNATTSETITFKIWNAAEGKEHADVTPEIRFSSDSVLGDFRSPIYFEATDKLNRTLPLRAGWNWISFNVACPDSANIPKLLKSLSPTDGDLIKGQSVFSDYSNLNSWTGSLNSTGIKVEYSYRIKVAKNDTLVFKGRQIDPTSRTISINKGWNWIGFVSLRNLPVKEAFGNTTPKSGEVIKAQSKFAIYDTILGWSGSLATLEPNKGYMFKALANASFTYPLTGIFARMEDVQNEQNVTKWSVDEFKYEFNMNYIAKLNCGQLPNNNITLGAFVGSECRGVISVSSEAQTNGLFYLTIFSNTNGENVTFKLMNELGGEIKELSNSVTFVNNDIQGTSLNPILLSATNGAGALCQIISGIEEQFHKNEIASIQPVPFANQFKFSLNLKSETDVNVIMRDINSNIVFRNYFGVHNSGYREFGVEPTNIASGVYFVEVILNSETLNFKTIKR